MPARYAPDTKAIWKERRKFLSTDNNRKKSQASDSLSRASYETKLPGTSFRCGHCWGQRLAISKLAYAYIYQKETLVSRRPTFYRRRSSQHIKSVLVGHLGKESTNSDKPPWRNQVLRERGHARAIRSDIISSFQVTPRSVINEERTAYLHGFKKAKLNVLPMTTHGDQVLIGWKPLLEILGD